jgi:hypothetical protein
VNGPESRSVSRSHVLVQRLHRVRSRHLPVLLVHVVGSRARVVADPDAEVLDFHGAFLVDLNIVINPTHHTVLPSLSTRSGTYHVQADDLSICLLDLAELHEEVPESRLGYDGVRGEDSHAVEFGGRVCIGGEVATDYLVLVEAPCVDN